ncbi:MAG: asparagine synthase-related protein [Polyangiaceae bacterium]
MKAEAALDWHGIGARYRRLADGAESARLRDLGRRPWTLDAAGVDVAWGLGGDATRTLLAGVRRVPSGSAPPGEGTALPWGTVFEAAVARIAAQARAPALALGGGLDAAAVLVAWCQSGAPPPRVLTLSTGLAGYDEVDAARRIAAACGARCEVVEAPPSAWLEALPCAVASVETPLYNLHPVGRYLLAREARRRGHDTLITGDGADAAFAALPDLDYVPLIAALGAATAWRCVHRSSRATC